MFSLIVFDVCSQQVRVTLCIGRQALETLQQTKIAAACIHSFARTDQQYLVLTCNRHRCTQPDFQLLCKLKWSFCKMSSVLGSQQCFVASG